MRAVLYRNRDRQLAARAAKCIFDYVAASRAKGGKRILYDFSMLPDDSRNLFCSKLVRLAYSQGSNGNFIVSGLFALSFDPYSCVELRWGDVRASCPDQAAKRQSRRPPKPNIKEAAADPVD